jgi:hypothetical protein
LNTDGASYTAWPSAFVVDEQLRCTGRRRELERPKEVHVLHDGLVDFAAGWVVGQHSRGRLAVQQHRRQRRGQVAALASAEGAVLARFERVGHGLDVPRRWVGGHKALDQRAGHERRRVLVADVEVDQRLGLVLGVAGDGLRAGVEGRRVAEGLPARQAHGRPHIPVEDRRRGRRAVGHLEDRVGAEAQLGAAGAVTTGLAGERMHHHVTGTADAVLGCASHVGAGIEQCRVDRAHGQLGHDLLARREHAAVTEDELVRHRHLAHAGVTVRGAAAAIAAAAAAAVRAVRHGWELAVGPVHAEQVLGVHGVGR